MTVSIRAALRFAAALAVSAAAVPADAGDSAGLPPDPVSTWTLQGENSSISSAKLTDRYYTNGIRLGWTSGTDVPPAALQDVSHALWGDGQTRISFDLTQQIYTPTDTRALVPAPGDRPYAGVLMGNFALWSDTADTRSMVGIGLGVVGPAALGEQVQNGFHDLIGQDRNNGWDTQLHDEPVVQLTSARTWRIPTGTVLGLETDALPNLQAGVGNLRVYAEGGLMMRLGDGLTSDFGPSRIMPGPNGGDVIRPVQPFAWYVFLGASGQGIAKDLTIEGNDFHDSNSAKLRPFVGEFQGGLSLLAFGARLTYSHVVQTQEFRGQKGGLHQFGSLSLSVRF